MNSSVPDGWKSVKLDDVAEETSDRVDNPCKSGYDRFVGLDHLDRGELTVRRWGSTANLLSAMKFFKSGDILIGRRNAYLKRASMAEFDGVCSGDAYVVREKPGTIAEGLLPIILNSDSFWDYTIAHASGTMSKRAKWRDLAEYSFLLPSLEGQRHIATTLWAAEDCIVKGERFILTSQRAKQVLMRELFSKGIGHTEFQQVKGFEKIPKCWIVALMNKIVSPNRGSIKTGPFGSSLKKEDMINDGIKVYGQENIIYQNLSLGDRYISQGKFEELQSFELRSGDLVFTRMGTLGKCMILPVSFKKGIMDFHLLRIRPDPTILDTEFLKQSLEGSEEILRQVQKFSQGGIMSGFSSSIMSKIQIPLPPLPEQRLIAAILTRCDETIAAARANVMAAKALKMKMINEMLGSRAKLT